MSGSENMKVHTTNGKVIAGLRAELIKHVIKRDCISRPGHYVSKVGVMIVDFDLNDDGTCTLRKLKQEKQKG